MFDEDLWSVHIVVVALYLRGAPRKFAPSRRNWPKVVAVLREAAVPPQDAADALFEAGIWEEAMALRQPGLLSWAIDHAGHSLSVVSLAYPARWLLALASPPPAVWFRGSPPQEEWLGVVGGRCVPSSSAKFARQTGAEASRLGFAVVSGGAVGCDSFAVEGAFGVGGNAIRILPCGLGAVPASDACDVTACAPYEAFSTGNAMERNALIYGAARASVVVHARFRQGGTWHGATDALRRRVGQIVVREDAASPAHRALVSLGAWPLSSPESLGETLLALSECRVKAQGSLFAAA